MVWFKGQPDPLGGPHPLPTMSLPSLAACSPSRLIAEVELDRAGVQVGGGMQSRGEAPQNVIGIIWTYLQDLMGRGGGVPMAHGDLRRLFFRRGKELGGRVLAPPPPSWGPRSG